jgi:hypothetical protein
MPTPPSRGVGVECSERLIGQIERERGSAAPHQQRNQRTTHDQCDQRRHDDGI